MWSGTQGSEEETGICFQGKPILSTGNEWQKLTHFKLYLDFSVESDTWIHRKPNLCPLAVAVAQHWVSSLASGLIPSPATEIKYHGKSNTRETGFTLTHNERVQSLVDGKSKLKEFEASGHTACRFRKHRVGDGGCPSHVFFLVQSRVLAQGMVLL